MIENGGGNVATQYFMWLALYPTMASSTRSPRALNASQTGPGLSPDTLLQFLSTPDGIITSQIGQYGTQQTFQGGSNVSNTGFFNLLSTPQAFLDRGKDVVYNLPFESYVLLSNSLSGSSASIFEHGVRAYAKKYAGEVTPLTAVPVGCVEEAATCPLTQFSGGNGQLNAVYASIPGVFATNEIASFLNETGIVQTQGDRDTLERYMNRLGPDFIEPIPDVPFLQAKPASYAYNILYPHAVPTSENVIPMEFLNQPADAVIDVWPRPGSTDAPSNVDSLPELYQEASKYFMTKGQAAAEAGANSHRPRPWAGRPARSLETLVLRARSPPRCFFSVCWFSSMKWAGGRIGKSTIRRTGL